MLNFMTEDDLQVGDVIFFVNKENEYNHVAIYSGKRDVTHFITHAVHEPYYSVMTTRLKESDVPYQVYRPKDFKLGLRAAYRMQAWVKYQVSFNPEMHFFKDELGDAKSQAEIGEKYFPEKFYRYIEFAAHAQTPFFPNSVRGMTCSEAVEAAFIIEHLLMIDAVKSYDDLENNWISDNGDQDALGYYFQSLDEDKKPSARYMQYLKDSHSINEYPYGKLPSNNHIDNGTFSPSFTAWNYKNYPSIENFVNIYQGFPLKQDPRISMPAGMLYYFQNHPEHWHNMGLLNVEKKIYEKEALEKNKNAWREYVNNVFAGAEEKKEKLIEQSEEQGDFTPSSPCKTNSRYFTFEEQSFEPNFEDLVGRSAHKAAIVFGTPEKKIPYSTLRDSDAKSKKRLNYTDANNEMDVEDPFLNMHEAGAIGNVKKIKL